MLWHREQPLGARLVVSAEGEQFVQLIIDVSAR